MKDKRFRRPSIAYAIGASTPYVFVPALKHGTLTLWIRTDPCVAEVACPYCEASVGEPCHNIAPNGEPRQPLSGTHYKRRAAAQEARKK